MILEIFSPKMTMVRPKTIPWHSNQMLRSICMDTVLQNSHDDKLTVSLITLASVCSYGHENIKSQSVLEFTLVEWHQCITHTPHTQWARNGPLSSIIL